VLELLHHLSVPVRIVDAGTDWAAWAEWVTAVILGITLYVARKELRGGEQTRFSELIADLSRRWDEPLLSRARLALTGLDEDDLTDLMLRTWEKKVTLPERRIFYQIQALPNFIETLAVIEYDVEGLSLKTIDALWGSQIIGDWERWKPAVLLLRTEVGDDTTYANFELLAKRLRWYRDGHPRELEPRRNKRTGLQRGPVLDSGGGSGGMP